MKTIIHFLWNRALSLTLDIADCSHDECAYKLYCVSKI